MKKRRNVLIIILLILIFALHIIDYFQTMYTISIYGIGVEANPIARFLVENNLGWASKFIAVPIMLTGLGFIIKYENKQIWAAYVLLGLSLAVVTNNFIVMAQMGII